MAVDRFPLEASEMEPLAKWFRITLRNAERAREQQDHGQAAGLVEGCARVFRLMREHGAEHGYSADLLFADIREEIARAGLAS